MISTLYVFLGGGLGSLTRYGINRLAHSSFGTFFWGNLAANLLGAFLAGLAVVLIFERKIIQPPLSNFALAGYLGGLTTFSGILIDANRLAAENSVLLAIFYVALNLILGFGLFALARVL